MSFQRTRAMFRKELRHILRDPRSLLMALAEPCVMLLLFGYALSLDVDQIATLVYDADNTVQSRELIDRFQASRYFQIRGFTNDYGEIERSIDKGRILIGIAVPQGYGKAIQSGSSADVQFLIDGSDSNTASIGIGYISSLIRDYSVKLRYEAQNRPAPESSALPVEVLTRALYNSTLESKNYVVPGLISAMLMIVAALLTSLTIAREWETGTFEQLMSTPVRPAEIVLGKMGAYFLVGIFDTVLAVVVGVYVFEVPLRGDLLLLAVSSGVFLFGALCWGIFLSAATRSQLMAYQLGMSTSLMPSMILSGFLWSIENMPPAIQAITYVVPARYFVTILKGVFLKDVGLEVVGMELVFLLIFCTLVFLGATRHLAKRAV